MIFAFGILQATTTTALAVMLINNIFQQEDLKDEKGNPVMDPATGLLSGVADTVVILPTKDLIFVESKTDVGRQSKAQKEFEKRVTNLGYKYFIIRTFDEFKKNNYNFVKKMI